MKYYPLTRVKINQYTAGEEYTLNGNLYIGPYYTTFDGQAYTGKNPIQGPSLKLTKLVIPIGKTNTPTQIIDSNDDYKNLMEISSPQSFLTPRAYYPKPTEEDYKRKSFTRYFAKKRNQPGYIIEIDKSTYDSLQKVDSVYDYITYETISTFWQIAGPLRDTQQNGVRISGIIDTNTRLILSKESSFPGLTAFIGGEYSKFSKPTIQK